MDLIADFKIQALEVLTECKNITATYPPSMKQYLDILMSKLHLLPEQELKAGFAYLMPYWCKDSFALSNEACFIIAVSNTFGLLYFMAQDEIYDSSPEELDSTILPLSNLFYNDFIGLYRRLFSSDSVFWTYLYKYIREWAESILWERKMQDSGSLDYSCDDFIKLARKAAPLKVPFAAVCILSGREQAIECFEHMLDFDQGAFQMIDDWRDWEKDLKNQNITYLLSEAVKYNKLSSLQQLDEAHVKKAVFSGDIVDKVMNQALELLDGAKASIAHLDLTYLNSYLAQEISLCTSIKSKITGHKEATMSGGLNMLLSRLVPPKNSKGGEDHAVESC